MPALPPRSIRRTALPACALLVAALLWTAGATAQTAEQTAAQSTAQTAAQSAADPEAGGPPRTVERVSAAHALAVTANPHATHAAVDMLRSGGNAVDAAVTAAFVLGVVEPQSSGLGGGGFAVLYRAKDGRTENGEVVTLDGRESAPAAVTPGLFLGPDGKPLRFYPERITGGRAVGVPGLVAMLALALERFGTRSLADTLQPAIALAEQGFAVSPRLAAALAGQRERLAPFPATRAVFFDARPEHAGETLPEGALLRQPELARAFRELAAHGPDAFYRGPIGAALVAAVRESPVAPGALSAADLASYRALLRPPVRSTYRGFTLVGMGPPSSGATTVFELLNLLETRPRPTEGWLSPPGVHRFVQAARVAYADRGRYLGDPDFVPVPTAGLLDKGYAAARAAALDWDGPLQPVEAGTPPGAAPAPEPAPRQGRAGPADTEARSTTHLTVADAQGNVIAMTVTIEQAFGSGIVVPGWGFLLNNELTDFEAQPLDEDGRPRANAVAPGKRPRSSMAPTLALKDGKPALSIGSPGGSRIIQFVAEVLLRVLDDGMALQDAIEAPHHTVGGPRTFLEPGLADTPLLAALRRLGHRVEIQAQASGLHGIRWSPDGRLEAGVDPRREGEAAGY